VGAADMPPAPNTDNSLALACDRHDMLSKQKEVKLLSPLKQRVRIVAVNSALCGVRIGVEVQICMYEPSCNSKLSINVDCACVG
jgi:hypothetical protein